jgi:hypothetical protein
MALEIFKLFGSIYVDSDKANESIAKTDKKAESVGGTLLKGVGHAAKFGAGLATAAATGVTALGAIAMKATDTAGNIDDITNRVGVSAEEWQKYAYAAKLSGLEQDKLEGIMKKSQTSFANASNGSKKLTEAYKEIGLNIKDIKPGDSFDATIKALANMEDKTRRNALASQIFGKSYADLNPLINSGADGIKQMKDEAVKMGAVMSNESVSAGAKFGDTIDKLKMGASGLFAKLGTSLIPILQKFSDMIIENMPRIQGIFATMAPVVMSMFSNLLPPLMQLVQSLFPSLMTIFQSLLPVFTQIISQVLPIFVDLIKMLLPPIMQIVQSLLPPLLSIVQALMPVFRSVMEVLKPIIALFIQLLQPILTLISQAIAPLITKLAGLINTVLQPIIPIIKSVANVIGNVLGTAFTSLKPYINNVIGYFNGLIDFFTGVFTGNWKKAFEGIREIVSNIFGGLSNIVKAPINFIIQGLNAFIKGINKVKIPDWVPGVGGKGLHIPEIPMLANGGDIIKAGRVLVGEKGPEFLDLPQGAKVTPLDKVKENVKEIILNLTLNIENFNNQSDLDIEKLSDDLAFMTKRKLEGGGIYELATV